MVKGSAIYELASDEALSDTRTFSYQSENQGLGDDEDELSEPEIAELSE